MSQEANFYATQLDKSTDSEKAQLLAFSRFCLEWRHSETTLKKQEKAKTFLMSIIISLLMVCHLQG